MSALDPELVELREFAQSTEPEIRAIIFAVLHHEHCATVDQLFTRNPDIAFELHDELCGLVVDTTGVGDFEHDLERETM